AQLAASEFASTNPALADLFRVEDGKVRLWQGKNDEVVRLLTPELAPGAGSNRQVAVRRLIILSVANARLGNKQRAAEDITGAESLCEADPQTSAQLMGEVLAARGNLALEENNLAQAGDFFLQGLTHARAASDQFLEAKTLLNLGMVDLQEERYDDALQRSAAASAVARSIGAQQLLEKALGNTGWAYYQTGDFERAFATFSEAAESAGSPRARSQQRVSA